MTEQAAARKPGKVKTAAKNAAGKVKTAAKNAGNKIKTTVKNAGNKVAAKAKAYRADLDREYRGRGKRLRRDITRASGTAAGRRRSRNDFPEGKGNEAP